MTSPIVEPSLEPITQTISRQAREDLQLDPKIEHTCYNGARAALVDVGLTEQISYVITAIVVNNNSLRK